MSVSICEKEVLLCAAVSPLAFEVKQRLLRFFEAELIWCHLGANFVTNWKVFVIIDFTTYPADT